MKVVLVSAYYIRPTSARKEDDIKDMRRYIHLYLHPKISKAKVAFNV